MASIRTRRVDQIHQPLFRSVQVVDRDRLTRERTRGLKREVIGEAYERVDLLFLVVEYPPIHGGGDGHSGKQLAIDGNAVLDVVLPFDVRIGMPGRRRAEIEVVARPDLVVLGDAVAVHIGPVAGVALQRRGVVAKREVGRVVLVVTVHAELERGLCVARQIVHGAEPGRDVEPFRQVRHFGKLAEADEAARFDRLGLDRRAEVLEPDPGVQRQTLELPGILQVQPEVRIQVVAGMRRRVVDDDRIRCARAVALDEVCVGVEVAPIRTVTPLHACFERVRAGHVRGGRHEHVQERVVVLLGHGRRRPRVQHDVLS